MSYSMWELGYIIWYTALELGPAISDTRWQLWHTMWCMMRSWDIWCNIRCARWAYYVKYDMGAGVHICDTRSGCWAILCDIRDGHWYITCHILYGSWGMRCAIPEQELIYSMIYTMSELVYTIWHTTLGAGIYDLIYYMGRGVHM